MPKQRITPGSGISPTTGRVAVGASDPYTPFTGNAAKGRLEQLARSLGGVGREATGFYRQQAQRQDEEDAKAGRKAFLEALEEQGNVADAIRAGRMRPGASKWFRWGVEAEAGAQSALRARDHFLATKGEELKEATTLEEFDQLASEAFDEYRETLGGTSEAFDNGFMPSYMAQLEQQRYSFATGIDGKLTQDMIDNFSAVQYEQYKAAYDFGTVMLASNLMGDDPTATMGFQAMAAATTADLDAKTRLNPKMAKQLKRATAETLITLANETGDQGFLDLAREIRVGPEEQGQRRTSLWADHAAVFVDETEKLAALNATRNNRAWQQDSLQRAITTHETSLAISQLAAGDMSNPRTFRQVQTMLTTLAEVDPMGAAELRRAIGQEIEFSDFTNPATYERIRYRIYAGTASAAEIVNASDQLSRENYSQLLGLLEQKQKGDQTGKAESLMGQEPINRWSRQITATRFEGLFGDIIADNEAAAAEALEVFRSRMLVRQGEYARILEEEGPNSPNLEALVQQEYNYAIDSTMREFQGQFREGVGEETRATDPVTDPPAISQQDTYSRFQPREVAETMEALNGGVLELPETSRPASFRAFVRRWNRLRPDAPVGSAAFGPAFQDVYNTLSPQMEPSE